MLYESVHFIAIQPTGVGGSFLNVRAFIPTNAMSTAASNLDLLCVFLARTVLFCYDTLD